ncbi:hypothetical protein JYB62_06105 [Algoriphagus lutimaris]|uniref:hypothetical protein n=1 Tax=Algoriphagus lutimaris TaxID=613197 RepID=UPI00196A3706|nr:hypothetical protein [Algoriphagus lutimaris]MBN3519571.1 hypothetical protein [Algoriphagus lutimaris]
MNLNKFLIAFAMLAFVGLSAQAQGLKIPKMDIASQVLGILNDTKGLDLSSDQQSKLEVNNKSFVDDLMKINGSSASEDDKKASFLNLKNSRTKFLTDLLGSDLFKKYSGKILQSINPLKSKLGLAALAF